MTTLTVTRRLRGKVTMTRSRESTVMRMAQRPGQSVRQRDTEQGGATHLLSDFPILRP